MATNLLSVAGLVGSPITIDSEEAARGFKTTRVTDLVVRHASEDTYPEITGFLVRVGKRLGFAATADVLGLTGAADRPRIGSGRAVLRTRESALEDFDRRPSDVLLAADVLDRQIIDTDGAHVIRAADLYLAVIGGAVRLIALDTSVRTLVRRLGPRRLRTRPAPQRVIDWSHVDAFATAPDALHLCTPSASLTRMCAGDLVSMISTLAGREDAGAPPAERVTAERSGAEGVAAERLGVDRLGAALVGADRLGAAFVGAERSDAALVGADRLGADRANTGLDVADYDAIGSRS